MTVLLEVDGMSCVNCENRVKAGLMAAKGIQSVDTDLTAGTVEVEHDEAIDERKIKLIIEDLGYPVR